MKNSRKINVFSFVKFHVVIGGIIGLLAGILYSFGGLIIDTLVSLGWITTPETPGLSYGTILAFGALIGMPLIGATVGLICGICEALIFNVCAKWLGRIDINFEQTSND
ncbi:MAG: hypothetical protein KJP00_11515 [Bacteroidia bacterium]|nr:hypothetical protein [Bacteroidia bacterium]